jgi:hypothetical protein
VAAGPHAAKSRLAAASMPSNVKLDLSTIMVKPL